MSELSPSSIRTTKSLEEKIAAATSESAIKDILHQEALSQRVAEEQWDTSILTETPHSEKLLGTTVTINGIRYELTGQSEADLLAQESAIYRGLMQAQTPAAVTEQPRDPAGRFTERNAEEDQRAAQVAQTAKANRIAELEAKFKLGQISVNDFIRGSGLIEKHLAERDDGKQNQAREAATAQFLESAEGAYWRGGDDMLRMAEIISTNGLENAPDKLAVLKEGWELMQREEYESALTDKIKNATSASELRAAIAHDSMPEGSSFFGR